jgi:hypothetical protein
MDFLYPFLTENNGLVVTLTPIPLLSLSDQPDGDLLYKID